MWIEEQLIIWCKPHTLRALQFHVEVEFCSKNSTIRADSSINTHKPYIVQSTKVPQLLPRYNKYSRGCIHGDKQYSVQTFNISTQSAAEFLHCRNLHSPCCASTFATIPLANREIVNTVSTVSRPGSSHVPILSINVVHS